MWDARKEYGTVWVGNVMRRASAQREVQGIAAVFFPAYETRRDGILFFSCTKKSQEREVEIMYGVGKGNRNRNRIMAHPFSDSDGDDGWCFGEGSSLGTENPRPESEDTQQMRQPRSSAFPSLPRIAGRPLQPPTCWTSKFTVIPTIQEQ